MSDLHVVAVLKAKPGSEEAMGEVLTTLVASTRTEEGCLAYDLYTSAADRTTFITVERWRAQADLDAHMQTPHIAAALAAGADLFAAPPAIHPLVPTDV